MKHYRRYWLIIFDWYKKNKSIETFIDLFDLTTILLHCVYCVIDINVDYNFDYNFDIVKIIEYNYVIVASTYRVVF